MKKLAFAVLSLGLLTACGGEEAAPEAAAPATTPPATQAPATTPAPDTTAPSTATQGTVSKNYSYSFNGATITLDGNFDAPYATLGAENDYFEAPSCAFDGMDKIYYYSGVEVRTYPQGDEDFVSAVLLKDDTVTTAEGAYVGMAMSEVLEKHGSDYTQEASAYVYMSGESSLTFIAENDAVIAITYGLPAIEELEAAAAAQ